MLSGISQSQKTNTAYFHLHEVPGVENVETESRRMAARTSGLGKCLMNGCAVSVLQGGKSSRVGWW